MGNNFTSCRISGNPRGKLLLSDGTIHELSQPISVAELMLDHPRHVVVELRSFSSSSLRKPTPLPADYELDPANSYAMIPVSRSGKPTASLSSEEARRILVTAQSVLRQPSFPLLNIPGMRSLGVLSVQGKRAPIDRKQGSSNYGSGESECSKPAFIGEGFEERPEFLSKQFSSRGWKPSLGTIEEKVLEKKIPHWLFFQV